jgi:hypothetical protein
VLLGKCEYDSELIVWPAPSEEGTSLSLKRGSSTSAAATVEDPSRTRTESETSLRLDAVVLDDSNGTNNPEDQADSFVVCGVTYPYGSGRPSTGVVPSAISTTSSQSFMDLAFSGEGEDGTLRPVPGPATIAPTPIHNPEKAFESRSTAGPSSAEPALPEAPIHFSDLNHSEDSSNVWAEASVSAPVDYWASSQDLTKGQSYEAAESDASYYEQYYNSTESTESST